MSLHHKVFGLTLAAGIVLLTCAVNVRAEDQPKPSAKQLEAIKAAVQKNSDKAADKEDKEEDKEEAKDRYQLPEGGVKELLAFIQDTLKFRPKTQQEALAHRAKAMPAIKAAAGKVLEIATDEDKKLEGFSDAEGILLMARTQEFRTMSPADQTKLFDDIKAYLVANEKPSQFALNAASGLATTLEYSDNPERAPEVYKTFGAILVRSKDPELAKTGEKMEGAARRLNLMGNPLELSGTLMDGEKFDWASFRGKVVLVDFWATWCGPCRAELPNVKKNYELYHDKGFEVVGISLDRDRKALEAFLEKEQNPWVTVHDGDWSDNAVATYYGIMGIPTVILVDKEGKVVSTRARGAELGKKLAELLGPVEEPAEEKTEKSENSEK